MAIARATKRSGKSPPNEHRFRKFQKNLAIPYRCCLILVKLLNMGYQTSASIAFIAMASIGVNPEGIVDICI
jgi:hypothetical protein